MTLERKAEPHAGALDYAAHAPRWDGPITVDGLAARVTVHRDAAGIPHIEAPDDMSAWFVMGYACAQDRLWQMEWYRRRGTGRWAEVVGRSGVAADIMFRRLRLAPASQVDVAEMSADTRAMFEAYAAGVNAYVAAEQPLPPEYALTGTAWEPWEPWHAVLVFKVRHAIMGKRLSKLAHLEVLRRTSPETYALLESIEPSGINLILPPNGVGLRAYGSAAEEVRAMAADLGTLGSAEGGSNSWAVHGSRTTTGKPVLVNDSHRPLDVPNVYWQVHMWCPDFNVAGAAFPGVPAFPHFGVTDHLAWNITHGQADYQDLWLEQFDPADPTRYRTEAGWARADVERSVIEVRGGASEAIDLVRTRNGEIVHGDPAEGEAIAMRYTATDRPNRQWETFRPMILARDVSALHETQRGWEEPVNAILSADTQGNIGFLFRGRVPVRSTPKGREFPAPGWTGDHDWIGDVPFEDLPQAINPPEGFLGTANQRPVEATEPYLAHEFTTPGRSTRIAEVLTSKATFTPEEIIAFQGDTTSIRGRGWAEFLATHGPFSGPGEAERARTLLAAWDGNVVGDRPAALLYECFRIDITEAVLRPILGEAAWDWLLHGGNDQGPAQLQRWMYYLGAALPGSTGTPDGRAWDRVLPGALAAAWQRATDAAGDNPEAWRWDAVHRTAAQHTLSAAFPTLAAELNPPAVAVGGDHDTLQVSSFGVLPDATFRLTNLSVYRQAVDFAALEDASWIVPGGASGIPGSPHYADQLEDWRLHRRIPMHLAPEAARAAARRTLTLEPSLRVAR
ncbi:MAG: penicillin acylase family protein [Dehalococcoidia bacterium]|nr:penicillin acylase family protein [Dehalococcoidia bacterium]